MKFTKLLLFFIACLLESSICAAMGPGTIAAAAPNAPAASTVANSPLPQVLFVREEGEQSLHPRVLMEALQGADLANAPTQVPFIRDLMTTLPLAMEEIQRTNIARDGVAPVSREINNLAKRFLDLLREEYRGEVAKNGRKAITFLILPSSRHGEFWGRGASLPLGRAWSYVYLAPGSPLHSRELLSSLEEDLHRQFMAENSVAPGGDIPQVDLLGVRVEVELTPSGSMLKTNLLLAPLPGTYANVVDSPEVLVEALVVPRARTARERSIVNVESVFESGQEFPSARFSLGRLSGLSIEGPRLQFNLIPPSASYVYCPDLIHLQGKLKDNAVPYDSGVLDGNRARFGFLGGRINTRTGLLESLSLRTDIKIGAWVCVHPDLVSRRFEAEINLIIEGQRSSLQPGSSIARELIMAVEAWERARAETIRP